MPLDKPAALAEFERALAAFADFMRRREDSGGGYADTGSAIGCRFLGALAPRTLAPFQMILG